MGERLNVVVCHAYLEPVQDFVHQLSVERLSKGVPMSTYATHLSNAHGVGCGADRGTNVVVRHAYLEPVCMGRGESVAVCHAYLEPAHSERLQSKDRE